MCVWISATALNKRIIKYMLDFSYEETLPNPNKILLMSCLRKQWKGNASAFSYTIATRVCDCQSMQIGLAGLDLWVTGWVWNVHCSWHVPGLGLRSPWCKLCSLPRACENRSKARQCSDAQVTLPGEWCSLVWLCRMDKSRVLLSAVSLYLAIGD